VQSASKTARVLLREVDIEHHRRHGFEAAVIGMLFEQAPARDSAAIPLSHEESGTLPLDDDSFVDSTICRIDWPSALTVSFSQIGPPDPAQSPLPLSDRSGTEFGGFGGRERIRPRTQHHGCMDVPSLNDDRLRHAGSYYRTGRI